MDASPYPQLDAIAVAFGVPPSGATLAVRHGGLVFSVELTIDSGTVRGLTIAVATPILPALRLLRESAFDRLGKAVGLARELQLGDPGFDPRVYIEGDDVPDAEARAVLAPAGVRRAVLSLLDRAEAVVFGPDGVQVEVRDSGERSAFDPVGFRATITDLAALVRALPGGLTVTPRWAVPDFGAAPYAWIALVCVGWGLAGVLFVYYRFVETTLTLVIATAGGAPLWLLSLVLLFFAVRGKSTSTSTFAMASFFLAIAMLPLGAGLFMLVNGLADSSPRVTHRVRILSAEAIHCEESTTAYCGTKVEVAPFGGARVEISDYTSPKPKGLVRGGQLDVVTRAGALGCAYVVAP